MAEAFDKNQQSTLNPELLASHDSLSVSGSDAASTVSSNYLDSGWDALSTSSADTAMTTDTSGKVVRRRKKIKKTTTQIGDLTIETVRRSKKRGSIRLKNQDAQWAGCDFSTWKSHGGGPLGISELQAAIPDTDDIYLFGMVQIKIGTGRFEKTKNLFIEFNGCNCKPMTRMTAQAKRAEAHKLLGECHAQIVFEKKEDVTISNVFWHVGHLFIAENIVGASNVFTTETVTIEEVQKEYERSMAKKAEEYLEAQRKLQAEAAARKPVPKKIDRIKEILSLFHEDMGWVNWVLFKATQKKLKLLHEESFGSGTIFALRQNLKEDTVLFGLLRLSFGVMPYRRTHFVLLHWVGPKTKNVKRGMLNARADRMAKMLEPWGIKLELKGADEITVENIIHKVRSIVVVDGEEEDPEEIIEQRLIEEFNKALEEEENANKNKDRTLEADKPPEEEEVMAADGAGESGGAAIPKDKKTSSKDDVKRVETIITETITLVQDDDEQMNWMLIEPLKKRKKRKKKKLKRANTVR